ncbi:MAG: beta-L-arabinofuranosidase domain-containing protein [Terracidiphilus sp.]
MKLTRRDFSKLIPCAAFATPVYGAEATKALTGAASIPRLESFNYAGVRLLDGPLKRQFQACSEIFSNIPNDSIVYGFRQRAGLPSPGKSLGGWYGKDYFNAFGQYLAGMARMAKASGDAPLQSKAVLLMHEWAKAIDPDGYSFYTRKPNVQHYPYEKIMGGLNDLYEYADQKDALVYAGRITDWAIKNLDRTRENPPGGGGQEWYTLSENLYRAYLNTGDPKYREFARVWHYDKYWDGFSAGNPNADGLHAYSHLNTLSSAAMAYRVSGDPRYLRTIVNAYDYFQRTQCYATGGYGPAENLLPADGSLGRSLESSFDTFETPCGSWAVFKLSRYLIGFTGEARFGDWIERIVYNGIGAALPMTHAGDTFYYSDYRICGAAKVYYEDAWPCCSGTYPQAVADYHNLIYFKDGDGLYVNLFVPSEVTWNRGGGTVVLRQETAYPERGHVVLTIASDSSVEMPLSFRVPGFASTGVPVKINGKAQNLETKPGTWAKIGRRWRPGDKIELEIPLQLSLASVDKQHPNRAAVTRGPLVLVRQEQPPVPGFRAWTSDDDDPAAFEVSTPAKGRFVPFYRVAKNQPYQMYFDLEA